MSSQRKKKHVKKSGTSIIIPIIIIILAIIAAIYVYHFSEPKPAKSPETEQIQNLAQPKNTQKESVRKAISENKTLLEGIWVSLSNGAMLEFHNHQFSFDIPSVNNHSSKKGSFSIERNHITFAYAKGETPCNDETGIYTFKLSKGILHLKVKKDNCKTRKNELVAAWERFNKK